MSTIGNLPSYLTTLFSTSTTSLFGTSSSSSTSTALPSISSTDLLDYFAGTDAANAERTSSSTSSSSNSTPSTSTETPPWDEAQPSQLAENAAVLSTTNFIDPTTAQLSAASQSSSTTSEDNQNLFTLYD